MLKLSIDIQSGILEFKERVKANPENRNLFLQGILLYLMGERVSLYALKNLPEDARSIIIEFLSKVELKGRIITSQSNIDVMLFSQHKKDGVPRFALHNVKSGELLDDRENSRLNPKYRDFIADGLFDMFAIQNETLTNYHHQWECHKGSFIEKASPIINNDSSYDNKSCLTKEPAESLLELLNNLIRTCRIDFVADIGDTPYNTVMEKIESATDAKKVLLSKKKTTLDTSREDAKNKLISHQIRMCLFASKYIQMYLSLFTDSKKPTNCSKFGQSALDMKVKRTLQDLLNSLRDISLPVTDMRSANGATEFFKSMMQASSYGVAKTSPVKAVRYDGTFELYVDGERDLLADILNRIESSNRYFLNIGKRSFGKLRKPSGLAPRYMFDEIEDDVKVTAKK